MAKEIAEEYTSSLADLTLNSKPLINMLTMLADENIAHSEAIVEAVEKHLEKVRSEYKLPVLYLIDSIVKNVGSTYVSLFTRNIVNTFCSVFEKVDEKVRAQMFKLRQTWNDVFPPKKLYALDVRVQCIDPAWPITATTPTPNIHVNPRFFNNQTATNNTATTPTTPTVPVATLDPTTLDMQAQLINKHKELLELRQKKLELELLQAKAKLEEQQKQLQSVKLLSKAEVPKPALPATKDESKIPVKVPSQVVAPTTNKSAASPANNSSSAPRINPVNSAMLASVRPMLRDPRLLRQQPAPATVASSVAVPTTQIPTPITSNNFETVNIDDKHKVKSKSHITINIDCASNDKTSINKAGAQSNTLTRKDPRLISNKVPGSADGNKNKSNNGRSVSNERSPTKKSNSAPSRKSSKSSSSSRSFKSSGPKVDVSSKNSSEGGAASSVSIKNVKDSVSSKGSSDSTAKSSPSSSPNKYKKKTEHSSPKSDKNSAEPKRSKSSTSKSEKSSRSRDRASSDKYDDENSRAKSPSPETTSASSEQRTFKGLKASTKNRNYMRRNREVSISPEPNKDVDLRLGGPPEKQARLQPPATETPEESNKSTTVDDNPSNKDVDLRTLVVPAAVSKKRASSDKLEPSNAKKSKSQIFDVLFGNEDVDLRQLPTVLNTSTTAVPVAVTTQAAAIRPPTPPPPIISTVSSEKQETKTKDSKSSLDAIRAKLANATKKSFNDSRKTSDDTDLRLKQSVFNATDSAEDVLQKIIISQADEQLIKNGNLSQALVEKVLTLFETQKLQEAQRRESEEVKHNDLANTTLTPISDDELSVDFSHSDSDDDSKPARKSDVFGDTDERVPPPAPVISQNAKSKEDQSIDSAKNNADPRLINSRLSQPNQDHTNAGTPWHAHHRRRRPKTHWDSPPPPHPGPEPWLRPPPAVLSQAMYGPRRPFPPFVRPGVDSFGPRMDGAIPMPIVPPHILESTRTTSPPTIGSQNTKELPMADPLVLEYIEQDTMRTINIDGRPREIRYYEETAIVILSWDDPREISFQNGTRLITFDDKESFTLSFNDTYRDVTIGGKPHRIRLGAPTRELYIDGKWYECFFGGPGIGIELDGKMHVVKMEGPPPHVKIGTIKRTDLVAGKINLIINARTMVPVFLDAKPQKFDIEGKIHTLRFVDALRTVLVNEVPFKVEFGGLPKPITVHDKKHFIRFSVLPRGIKPGYVNIANMEGHRFPSPPRNETETINDTTAVENIPVSVNEPALPMRGRHGRVRPTELEISPDNSSRNSPIMQNSLQSLGSLDVLSSIMTSPMANISSNLTGYQVDQDSQDGFPGLVSSKPNEIPGLATTTAEPPVPISFLPPSLNINELFQKLVATGIVTAGKEKTPPPPPPVQIMREEPLFLIKPVLFAHPETLKIRQAPLITALYSGMQCSSCGVRFPPEHSMQYSQHLDWHFRQNRRGRNSARKALCRKWYYDVSDWKNFEEIEDIEEREKNWFESQQQQQQAEGAGEDGDEEIEIPSVPADSSQNTRCEVCHDKFDQFYNEEKEEWHLRMAIREDGKTYHPLCYDDYKTSLANQTLEDNLQNSTLEHSESMETNEIPKEETADAEEEVKPEVKEEEIKEETEEKVEPKEELESKVEEEDDDIIIQEPTVEQIVIDDLIGDNDVDMKSESNDENIDDDILPGNIKIKEEPLDNYEINISNIKLEPLDHDMEETLHPGIHADTTHAELVSSIDGNVQCSAPSLTPATGIAGKIKINITKPIIAPKEPSTLAPAAPTDPEPLPEAAVSSNEPLPPGEEPVQLNLKPGLQGLTLTKQPPVSKGTELTGLCSIM